MTTKRMRGYEMWYLMLMRRVYGCVEFLQLFNRKTVKTNGFSHNHGLLVSAK